MRVVHESIDSDDELKKLRVNLAKNAQTQALISLLENISATEVELLLHNVKPDNQAEFKRSLWAFYIQNCPDTDVFLEAFSDNQAELQQIELDAATEAPNWSVAIELFNNRFVDMPFTLSLFNQVEAALGKDKAQLKFTFKDGDDRIDCTRSEIKSLSQGEKRALYLLNFIFEVEDRKRKSAETLFIIDDVADSFDYKNKHAIVQYLEDISEIEHFSQLILTHNFDFFRTLANNFVHRERCLMANRTENGIELSQAEGIKNYFIGKWKRNITNSEFILCATVPFTRNLLEYIKGETDPDYLKLTSLLHWKEDTAQITIGEYYKIYNRLFGTNYPTNDANSFKELLFNKANEIKDRANHEGLNLEDKVLLSIAIRMRSEIFLIEEMRKIKSDDTYWCQSMNQFGALIKSYIKELPDSQAISTLEKVSITVSSNIHLNSFMYEPILDLTIEHLITLYSEILELESAVPVTQESEPAL
ncbi:AAA family ATPase [Pseudoalteromonas sp. M58]